jgi:hypothetical protein
VLPDTLSSSTYAEERVRPSRVLKRARESIQRLKSSVEIVKTFRGESLTVRVQPKTTSLERCENQAVRKLPEFRREGARAVSGEGIWIVWAPLAV